MEYASGERPRASRLLVPAGLGAAIAIAVGVYANEHDPTGQSILGDGLFFSATLNMKAWFATAAVLFAVFQLTSALWIYGRLPGAGEAPGWVSAAHKLSGTAAFLVSLPVAYHCLWALGFQETTDRVFVHSLAGCFFYGAFVTKVVTVESKRLPAWALPVAGGLVFTALVVVWLTSAWWFFDNFGFPEF